MAKKATRGKKSATPQTDEAVSASEVARRAGVSVMTVSRALRGTENVSPKTRERVLAIARELGYEPSTAARALRTGIPDAVGFLTWSYESLRGAYHSETLAAIDFVLAREGYNVLLAIPPDPEGLVARARRIVTEGRVGGLVIQASRLSAAEALELGRLKVPVVLLNYPGSESGAERMTSVCYDNRGGIEQAVRHLAAYGHTRIAYIGGTPEDSDAHERLEGFKASMRKLKLAIKTEWMRPGDFSIGRVTGNVQGDYLMAESDGGPTAIVCASDDIAAGVLESTRRAGRRIPEHLSIVGFDNVAHAEFTVPALTTLNHGGWEIGLRAGTELLKSLENPLRASETCVLPVMLVIRGSTGPVFDEKRTESRTRAADRT